MSPRIRMLSAVGDARGSRALVYPRPTSADAAHHTHTSILPHAHAHAHTSSSSTVHARCTAHAATRRVHAPIPAPVPVMPIGRQWGIPPFTYNNNINTME